MAQSNRNDKDLNIKFGSELLKGQLRDTTSASLQSRNYDDCGIPVLVIWTLKPMANLLAYGHEIP